MIRRIEMAAGTVALSDERPVRGAARAVRPLVLLHGFTGSHESWAAARATFRAQRRVIAIDLPGHGATVVRDAAFDWSLAAAADLVAATLAALRIGSADVLGYSMGGRVALQMALAHPARVGRLVLESAPAGLAASLRGMGLGAQPWLGGELETLPMPVLLVSGERDAKFTRIAASLLPLFAAGTHEIVAGAGHLPHLEQPARFLRVVCDFLDGGGRRREFRRSLSRGEDA